MSAGFALVTGASSGLGAACARALLGRGYKLAITSRDGPRALAAARELDPSGKACKGLPLELGDENSRRRAAQALLALQADFGSLTCLVHNAGSIAPHPVLTGAADAEHDPYRQHLEVLFHGPRRLSELLLPSLLSSAQQGLDRPAALVLINSAAGLRGFPRIAAYCAAKHALLGWARSLALELQGQGLAVISLCPYYAATPMLAEAARSRAAAEGLDPEAARARFVSRNPGARAIEPGEVAEALLRCLEPQTLRRSNGRVLVLDGGAPRDLPEDLEPGLSIPLSKDSLT